VTKSPKHSEINDLTGAYVLDALSPAEVLAYERHVGRCPDHDQEVRELSELRMVTAQLAVALAVPPPPSMRDLVLARIHETRQYPAGGQESVVIALPTRRRRVPLIAATVAAAAAVAAIAVTSGVVVGHGPQLTREAEDSGVAAVLSAPDATTRSAGAQTGGLATAVMSRREGKVAVSAIGLPVLDSDHTYQVWLIGGHGPRSGGLLHSSVSARGQVLVANMPADTDRMAITEEPAGGSPAPSAAPIVRIDLT